MGEMAEDLMAGLFCEQCGELIDGEAPGYPRNCGCEQRRKPRKDRPKPANSGKQNHTTEPT